MSATAPKEIAALLRWAPVSAMTAGSLPMLSAYPGDAAVLIGFCLSSIAVVAAASFGRLGYFSGFLAAFLTLGFWAKLNLYWTLGIPLLEPIGSFPDTEAAWDAALSASAAGLAGVAGGMGAAKLLGRRKPAADMSLFSAPAFGSLAAALFALSSIVAVTLFVVNYHFAILKIGTVPRVPLHPYLYAIVSFTVSWGTALWLAALAFWLVGSGRAPVDFPIYASAVEGALAALSMGSRAQMILHMAACLAALATCMRLHGWRARPLRLLSALCFAGVLFAASLAGVSLDRISSFYGPPPTVAAKHPGLRTGGRGSYGDRDVRAEQTADAISGAAVARMGREVTQLFVGRWIGIEGVLAVSSAPDRGLGLLRRGATEEPALGVDAMYQRLAKSIYQRSERFVFLTVPGPIAVLLYGGNMTLAAIGMAVFFGIGFAIERLCDAWVRNPAASATVGAALAYLLVQMMFPRTLLMFAIELVLALAVIGVFRLACRRWIDSAQAASRRPQDVPPASPP